MKVNELINEIAEKKIMNTKLEPEKLQTYLKDRLEVKDYVPFVEKRQIVEMVVQNNMTEVDDIKKIDSISQYVSFVIAMLVAHTNLEISENPIDDYDVLSKNGLLEKIIELFKKDYDECNVLLKMITAQELEENNINYAVARFLNNIIDKLGSVGDFIKSKTEGIDINDVLRNQFKEEDLTRLKEFLNK